MKALLLALFFFVLVGDEAREMVWVNTKESRIEISLSNNERWVVLVNVADQTLRRFDLGCIEVANSEVKQLTKSLKFYAVELPPRKVDSSSVDFFSTHAEAFLEEHRKCAGGEKIAVSRVAYADGKVWEIRSGMKVIDLGVK